MIVSLFYDVQVTLVKEFYMLVQIISSIRMSITFCGSAHFSRLWCGMDSMVVKAPNSEAVEPGSILDWVIPKTIKEGAVAFLVDVRQ